LAFARFHWDLCTFDSPKFWSSFEPRFMVMQCRSMKQEKNNWVQTLHQFLRMKWNEIKWN
jgi:hypothetical protein